MHRQNHSLARRPWARWTLSFAAVAICWPALAFYPFGGWDSFGTLRYVRWKLSDFDLNNDGIVTPEEGREIQIEGGPAGFNAAEIDIIRASLQTWEDVPTTYASFKERGIFQDPILPGSTLEGFDTVSSIFLQVTANEDTGEEVIPDPDAVFIADVAFPVLGINLPLFTVDEETVEIAGQIVTIPAGTIIDSDIVINAAAVRAVSNGVPTSAPLVGLQGVMVHELGHFLGLGHPALSNLRPEPGLSGNLLESPVLPYTAGDGIQRLIGVTPTMFPFAFLVVNEQSQRIDGGKDLAPDDISGVSWNYPRGPQGAFFDISHEARTQSRPNSGLPSVPIPGGHVVAWADQDGNPDTPRIPVFATMTALFTPVADTQLEGQFKMPNVWKQVEVQGLANTFRTPSYVFTLSPLSGGFPDVNESYIRQTPSGITPDQIDSLHNELFNTNGENTRSIDDYITSFASEVFQEDENIIDVSNRDAGTGMVWSFEQNTLVSTATGKTLATILPGNRPMFGDPNDVCPLFASGIPSGGGTSTDTSTTASIGYDRLRAFRDDVLLKSAIGTAAVSVYYRAAPAVTAYLFEHEYALNAFRSAKFGAFWMMENAKALAVFAGLSVACIFLARRRRVLSLAAAATALWLALAAPAPAQLAYQTLNDFVAGASDIVSGSVVESESRWAANGRIVTDITVEIEDTAKGNAAKANSSITFTVIGGKIGGFVMNPSETASFKVGEQAVLYLREYKPAKFAVYGGFRGKVIVSSTGGAKTVSLDAEAKQAVAENNAKKAGKSAKDAKTTDTVSLDDYMDCIRSIVAEQEAAEK